MYPTPSTITSSTTATLTAVMTALTRDDNLVPSTSNTVRTPTSRIAPQSNWNGPPSLNAVFTSIPTSPSVVCRYADHPLATAADPTANSSTRSQPMIQAANSPNVA